MNMNMTSLICSAVIAAVIGGIVGEVLGGIYGINGGVAMAGPFTLLGIYIQTITSTPSRVA